MVRVLEDDLAAGSGRGLFERGVPGHGHHTAQLTVSLLERCGPQGSGSDAVVVL